MKCSMTNILATLLWWMATASTSMAIEPGSSRQPAGEVRDVARRILAEPEFRHFEHFADDAFRRGEPDASPSESSLDSNTNSDNAGENPSSTSTESKTSSSANEPWWRRALNPSAPSKSGSDSGSSRNQRLSPSGPSSGDGSPSTKSGPTSTSSSQGSKSSSNDNTAGQTKREPGDATTKAGNAAPPAGTPSNGVGRTSPATERPTRTGSESASKPARANRPAQRGSDGVERPVRQANRTARAPTPEPTPRGPEWSGASLGLGNLLGGLFHGLAYLILVVIVAGILVLIGQALAQAWNDRPRNVPGMSDSVMGPLTHDRSPGETESDVFVQEALALAQRGEYRAAIGKLVLGGMSFIERQQWIRYRRGLTVHDYLRVLRSRPDQFTGFRQVVQVFEPVEYGRRLATEPLFDAALQGYRRGFQRPASPIAEERV